MRLSQFPIVTSKETPADAEIVSHQLMLRSGMIRRVASGLYAWTPIGLRALRKVEAIVREEMNKAGAVELLMPSVHPAELWQESGRWDVMGPEMLRIKDRHDRDYCYGPTHEEVITSLVRQDVKSYKQLPLNYYQIQTKFRDEIRPRFGVMRSREFIMKDAYSFNMDEASLDETYATMRAAYSRIFSRMGVEFRIVEADSGNIGGKKSEEFHVLAGSGEDLLAVSDSGSYAANVEAAVCLALRKQREAADAAMHTVDTPDQRSIAQVSKALGVAQDHCLKTLIVKNKEGALFALCLQGNHELNELKADKLLDGCEMASDAEVLAATGCAPGSVGPVGLKIPVLADIDAASLGNFVCGANSDDQHFSGVNWERDLPEPRIVDLRNVEAGDSAPDGGKIQLVRGIEVGHIFQLGKKYTESLKATVLDANGKDAVPFMGCYGIGVTRVVGAVIEQCHDDKGIVWPEAAAPFQVLINAINPKKSEALNAAIEEIYQGLLQAGFDVAWDDRGLRPGQMFGDADLLGIPHRVVLSERGLENAEIEYKHRSGGDAEKLPWSLTALIQRLQPA
ncbi:MAG: proline--tRNA ligase [Oceanococcus sp.]